MRPITKTYFNNKQIIEYQCSKCSGYISDSTSRGRKPTKCPKCGIDIDWSEEPDPCEALRKIERSLGEHGWFTGEDTDIISAALTKLKIYKEISDLYHQFVNAIFRSEYLNYPSNVVDPLHTNSIAIKIKELKERLSELE